MMLIKFIIFRGLVDIFFSFCMLWTAKVQDGDLHDAHLDILSINEKLPVTHVHISQDNI